MNINECESSPCASTGVCVDEVADYSCQCTPGYTGRRCDVDIDECAPGPCLRGACSDVVNNYLCDCDGTGFTGSECHIDIDECVESTPCQNDGQCTNNPGSFNCTCATGFTGVTCLDVMITETSILPIIIGAVVGVVVLLVVVVLIIVMVIVARVRYNKRHESYSPAKTEFGRSERAGFSTLPELSEPKERLI